MTIMTITEGPSTRAAYAVGVCSGHGAGLDRVHSFASVWSEQQLLRVAAPSASRRPRPDALSILDPQRASAPPRRSP